MEADNREREVIATIPYKSTIALSIYMSASHLSVKGTRSKTNHDPSFNLAEMSHL
jgi:hypothetical protein